MIVFPILVNYIVFRNDDLNFSANIDKYYIFHSTLLIPLYYPLISLFGQFPACTACAARV